MGRSNRGPAESGGQSRTSPVTLDEVKAHPLISTVIEKADQHLGAMGFTEHGYRHVELVSNISRNVLSRLSLAGRGNLIDETAVESVVVPSCSERLPRKVSGNGRLKHDLHEIQRAHVLTAYAETGNNISKTARRLGAAGDTIYRALRDKQS